jgi:hypothetical protein
MRISVVVATVVLVVVVVALRRRLAFIMATSVLLAMMLAVVVLMMIAAITMVAVVFLAVRPIMIAVAGIAVAVVPMMTMMTIVRRSTAIIGRNAATIIGRRSTAIIGRSTAAIVGRSRGTGGSGWLARRRWRRWGARRCRGTRRLAGRARRIARIVRRAFFAVAKSVLALAGSEERKRADIRADFACVSDSRRTEQRECCRDQQCRLHSGDSPAQNIALAAVTMKGKASFHKRILQIVDSVAFSPCAHTRRRRERL